jgi:predicted nucleic acid-binding protein
MNIIDAFGGVTRVFLDTAPVIYYVEATPGFAELARTAFTLIREGQIQAIVSPVTLAECVNLPIRLGQVELQQRFTNLLTNTNKITYISIVIILIFFYPIFCGR